MKRRQKWYCHTAHIFTFGAVAAFGPYAQSVKGDQRGVFKVVISQYDAHTGVCLIEGSCKKGLSSAALE